MCCKKWCESPRVSRKSVESMNYKRKSKSPCVARIVYIEFLCFKRKCESLCVASNGVRVHVFQEKCRVHELQEKE